MFIALYWADAVLLVGSSTTQAQSLEEELLMPPGDAFELTWSDHSAIAVVCSLCRIFRNANETIRYRVGRYE